MTGPGAEVAVEDLLDDGVEEGAEAAFHYQLLTAAVLQRGGAITVPVDLVNAAGRYVLAVEPDNSTNSLIVTAERMQ
jgi:hypothetical protein